MHPPFYSISSLSQGHLQLPFHITQYMTPQFTPNTAIYRHNYLQQIIQNIVLIFYCFIEFLPDIKMLQTLSYERFKNNYMTDSFRGNIRKTMNFYQPSHAKIVEQCLKLYSTLSIVLFSTIVNSQLLCLLLPHYGTEGGRY